MSATNEPGTALGNNSDSGDVTVLCADIDIAKTANPVGPVSAGDDIGFDVTVSNLGDGIAKLSTSPTRFPQASTGPSAPFPATRPACRARSPAPWTAKR